MKNNYWKELRKINDNTLPLMTNDYDFWKTRRALHQAYLEGYNDAKGENERDDLADSVLTAILIFGLFVLFVGVLRCLI